MPRPGHARAGRYRRDVPSSVRAHPWRDEAVVLARGASGGLLFGIPLLYTMEIWWVGTHTTPLQALGILAVGALPVYLLNQTSGFREVGTVRVRDAVMDTIEALALALVLVTVVLVLLREITTTTPLETAIAKAVYEALPFGIGVAVANHFLLGARDAGDADANASDVGGDPDDDDGAGDTAARPTRARARGLDATLADMGATAVGAVFVALNISPTDEIPMLAGGMGRVWTVALVAASLVSTYMIVFVAGFSREDQRRSQVGLFQHPLTETIASYLVALVCAALMLWVFQRHHGPWPLWLQHTLVLGLPAAIGGAAGRLAI